MISLQSKLIIILVFFVLVPVATSGLFFYISSENYVLERTAQESRQTLSLLQKNVDLMLRNYDEQLMTIYQNEEVIRHLSAGDKDQAKSEEVINRFLRDFLRGKDDIESIYLFSHAREAPYFYDQKGSKLFVELYKAHPEWSQRVRDSNGRTLWLSTYEFPPNQYSSRSTHYFIAAKQIKDLLSFFEPIGSILLNIRIETLEHMMADIAVSQHGFLSLLDDKGNVVWHRNPRLLGKALENLDFFNDFRDGEGSSTYSFNGEAYEVTSILSDYNGWRYVAFVPHADINAESANIKTFMNVTLLVSVIIFSLLASLLGIYITRPLRRMVVAMNRFGKNNLRVTLDADSRDEIGVLQNSFNSMSDKIVDLIEEVKVISAKEKEAEIKALRAQINPHFVYNTLDTINWMAIEHHQKEISRMIISLSDIMRYAIHPNHDFVTIAEELRWAENYVFIQKNRFEDRFDVEFDIDDRALSYFVPRLLLQPFIENAILHGMDEREHGGAIRIRVRLLPREHWVQLVVEDNGVGISADTLQRIQNKKNSGIGLNNIHERLRLEFGHPYGVTIDSHVDQGTAVTILVPCISQKKEGDEHV